MPTTFADIKRSLILGETVTLTRHDWGHKALGVPRTIVNRQTNGVQFDGGSWLTFPKASEIIVHSPTSFSVMLIGAPDKLMTYQIGEPDEHDVIMALRDTREREIHAFYHDDPNCHTSHSNSPRCTAPQS